MSKKDYYEVLGIEKNSNQTEIKRAFRKLAMKFHPDRNKAEDAEDKFKEINEAYEILSDPDKRSKYDQFGHAAFENGAGGSGNGFNGFHFEGFGGFEDIFSSFFGGRRTNQPRRGQDYLMEVTISFNESIFGKTFSRKLEKFNNGQKVVKDVEIKIPAGIIDGQSIALRSFGGPGENGGPNGDLMVRVRVKTHKHFKRVDNNIILEMSISIFDIIAGNEIEVPTPYGNELIKLHDNITSKDYIRIANKGFVSIRTGNYGDFIIKPEIYAPKLNRKEKESISKVAKNLKDKTYEKFINDFR